RSNNNILLNFFKVFMIYPTVKIIGFFLSLMIYLYTDVGNNTCFSLASNTYLLVDLDTL
ncbi:hypothetical protein BDA99DRAFT_502778, partial [Phascolomyces articulosus]